MKVIFLDIDGVLNTSQTFKDVTLESYISGYRRTEIDEFRIRFLKQIIDATGAVVVLSSSWRAFCDIKDNQVVPNNKSMKELISLLLKYGITIYDITPYDQERIREKEILAWLMNKDVESYIVIDDDSDDLKKFIGNALIKTNFTKDEDMIISCGLCEEHVTMAINKLNINQKCLIKK